ncbi:uncharacterized protein LOC126834694 [Adelges cooleyi]|uniref:uncharacterized protein LOC126834694 n=1 Tax=Adelges cooleyi TaxID=133065 RepID=UPI00217FC514|nr:uncharacterized protein LOC126834694 [Adelges cooleyi]
MCRTILILVLYVLSPLTSIATENNDLRLQLLKEQRLPQNDIRLQYHTEVKQNLKKNPPTNENITLFKYLDSEYYAQVRVGKPGQIFNVIFDTTWGDMWIPSKLCSSKVDPICAHKTKYDPDESSTNIPINSEPFNVSGLIGNLTCDTVRLAHLNVSDLVFAEIRQFPNISDYRTMYADGIIGLGYNNLAQIDSVPFFYKLLQDRKIEKPIFSLYLNRDITTKKGGIIFLGGIEPKHIDGAMTYVPVTKKGYWQFQMTQFTIIKYNVKEKNKLYYSFCDTPCQAVVDSSTNKIGVPEEQWVAINDRIGATLYDQERYSVDCSKVNKLPILTLNIGGRNFTVKPRHYIQKVENTKANMACLTTFVKTELPQNTWTLGGGFLSSVYTTFDLEQNRIGFANLASG